MASQLKAVTLTELRMLIRLPLWWTVMAVYGLLPLFVLPPRGAPYAFLTPGLDTRFLYSPLLCGELAGYAASLVTFLLLVLLLRERAGTDHTVRATELVAGIPCTRTTYVVGKTAAWAVSALIAAGIACVSGMALQLVYAELPASPGQYLAGFGPAAGPGLLVILAAGMVALQAPGFRRHVAFISGVAVVVSLTAATSIYPDLPPLDQPAYFLDFLGTSPLMIAAFEETRSACFVLLSPTELWTPVVWQSHTHRLSRAVQLGMAAVLTLISLTLLIKNRRGPCVS